MTQEQLAELVEAVRMSKQAKADAQAAFFDNPTMGSAQQRLFCIREHKKMLKRVFDMQEQQLKQEEADVEGYIINQLDTMGVTSASTDYYTVTKKVSPGYYTVEDGELLNNWIFSQGPEALTVLQRRLSPKQMEEYLDGADIPPGVTQGPDQVKLSMTKKR